MSSQWLNKKAIMRDLSRAQGVVPVAAAVLGAGDRPPALNIKEETEEAFFHEWVSDGEFSAPDIGLIQHMLEVVRNHDSPVTEDNDDSPVTDKSDKEDDHVIQIRKLNPQCPEFKPRELATGDSAANETNEIKEPKKKRLRNAALQSLLQNMKENIVATDDKKIKVKLGTENIKKVTSWLKLEAVKPPSPTKENTPMLETDPTLIFKKKKASEAKPELVKEAGWMKMQSAKTRSPSKKNAPMLDMDPTSMFKKKKASEAKPELVKEAGWMKMKSAKTPSPSKKYGPMLDIDPTSMFKKKKASEAKPEPVKEVKKTAPVPYNYNKYVPSENAAEYYKKFLQCSEMQQMVQENVWTKVEKQMKAIDERRNAEAELLSLSLALSREQDDASAPAPLDALQRKLLLVQLPAHRHALPAPCRLCALVARLRACGDAAQPHEDNTADHWRSEQSVAEDSKENVTDDWRKGNEAVVEDSEYIWRKGNEAVVEDSEENVANSWRKDERTVEADDNVAPSWRDGNETAIDKGENAGDSWQNLNEAVVKDDDKNVDDDRQDEMETVADGKTVTDENDNDLDSTYYDDDINAVQENVDNSTRDQNEVLKLDDNIWMTPLDDEEEIDAWKTEILGDDDDENQCIELVNNTFENTAQCLRDDDETCQNENHIEAVCYDIEEWQSVLLGRDKGNNENKSTTEEFDLQTDKTKDIQPFQFEITKPLEDNSPSPKEETRKSYRQFQINASKNHSNVETYDIFTEGPLFGYERMRYKTVKVDGENAYEPVYDEKTAWSLLLEDLTEPDIDLEEIKSS